MNASHDPARCPYCIADASARLTAMERFHLNTAREFAGRGEPLPASVALPLIAALDRLAGV